MFYRKPEREAQPPPILSIDLLRTMSAGAINDAMRKLPDPNNTESESVSVEYVASYHGKVRIEFERATAGTEGPHGATGGPRWPLKLVNCSSPQDRWSFHGHYHQRAFAGNEPAHNKRPGRLIEDLNQCVARTPERDDQAQKDIDC